MKEQLQQLKERALVEIGGAFKEKVLQDLEIKYLGRKGELACLLHALKELPAKARPEVGKLANEVKMLIQKKIATKKGELKITEGHRLEFIDVTAPGLRIPVGHLHLVTQSIKEIMEILSRLGFSRRRYLEVETDWYAFEGLNMPFDHPARDEWETFFISDKIVLTPHTSSGQLREMERGKLPIRTINISKCYRRQSDVSHVPMFHQIEGLYIDKNVSIGHLKGVLDYFAKEYFGPKREIRLRPSHFRFTEPSFEVDVSCGVCQGHGCRLCKRGWLELAGAGMVHPNVLRAGKVDPKKYSGFAFGWGVERSFMMKEGMALDDIRIIYKNDLRFLEQF